MANNSVDDTKRSGKLSPNLPRPNIVRIEVLDGESRERYLKSYAESGNVSNIYSAVNNIRKATYDSVFTADRAYEKIFYGFLSPTADTTINMGAGWEQTNISGSAFDMVKKVAGGVASVGGVVGGVGRVVGAGLEIGSSIQDISNRAVGMNSTATGASTMKDFKSIELNDFTVQCSWYLPEQEKLTIHSLKILYKMLYPRQISQEAASKLVDSAAKTTVNSVQKVASDFANSASANAVGTYVNPATPPENSAENNSATNKVAEFTGDVASGAYGITNGIGNFFGNNTTINPFPVRVCIGQHIDIEPLVITSIDTKFSRETFISEDNGRHLPLYAHTTISFKYWLNPAPNLEFLSILGAELFGDSMITSAQVST